MNGYSQTSKKKFFLNDTNTAFYQSKGKCKFNENYIHNDGQYVQLLEEFKKNFETLPRVHSNLSRG